MKQKIVLQDPIADMLTRIRNAIAVGKTEVRMPHSKTKETVANILVNNGFLASAKSVNEGIRKELTITINPGDESAKITEVSRLSRPGKRLYVKADDIPSVKRGRGIVVVSTSRGMMAGQEAKAARLGGELICKVY